MSDRTDPEDDAVDALARLRAAAAARTELHVAGGMRPVASDKFSNAVGVDEAGQPFPENDDDERGGVSNADPDAEPR